MGFLKHFSYMELHMGVVRGRQAHARPSDGDITSKRKQLANQKSKEKRKWNFIGTTTTMVQRKRELHVWTDNKVELLLNIILGYIVSRNSRKGYLTPLILKVLQWPSRFIWRCKNCSKTGSNWHYFDYICHLSSVAQEISISKHCTQRMTTYKSDKPNKHGFLSTRLKKPSFPRAQGFLT